MLKKIGFSFIALIILCGIANAARISDMEYGKLVDYVNCKYMVVYVDLNLSRDDQQQALGTKLQALRNCSLDNLDNIPNFETIKQALRQDVGKVKPQTKAQQINKLKEKSIENLNNDEIIRQILSAFADITESKRKYYNWKQSIEQDLKDFFNEEGKLPVFEIKKIRSVKVINTSLSQGSQETIKVKIQPDDAQYNSIKWEIIKGENEIIKKVGQDNGLTFTIKALNVGEAKIKVTVDDVSNSCVITVKGKAQRAVSGGLTGKQEDSKSSKAWWYFLDVLLLIVGWCGFSRRKFVERIKFIWRKIRKQGNIEDENTDYKAQYENLRKKCEALETDFTNLQSTNKILQGNNKTLLAKCKRLAEKCREFEKKQGVVGQARRDQKSTTAPVLSVTSMDNEQENSNILYADFIDENSGEFRNISVGVPSAMSNFVLEILPNRSTATFKVHKEAENRVIDRPNYLAGCDRDITPNGTVLTQTPGLARKVGDKWKVDKPLKVKIV